MDTKNICFVLVLITLLSIGCKDDQRNTTKSNFIPEGLALNNGEKWIANEATHVGMKHIDSILKNSTALDGKTLGDALSKETGYIIKSCDMKGEPHDQLHVILVPMLEEITDLKDITNSNKTEEKVTYLKGLVNTYFKYFKT